MSSIQSKILQVCRAGLWTAGMSVWLWSSSAIAAERVVLRYRFLQRSIAVADLTQLAETGEVPQALRFYMRASGQDPESVRQVLTQDVAVNVVTLDRVLNSPVGDVLLDQLSEAIYTRSGQANRQAMRSALVLSASDDNRISLLEVIQNYPTEEVYVDGERLLSAYRQLSRLQGRVGDLLNILQRINP